MQVKPQTSLFNALLIIGKGLGMSRSVAIVFAVLYDQDTPITVDDLAAASGLSKSAVSLALRELAQFGAVQEVNLPGERCRRYQGQPDLAQTVKYIMLSRVSDTLDEFRVHVERADGLHYRSSQARDLLDTFEHMVTAVETDRVR